MSQDKREPNRAGDATLEALFAEARAAEPDPLPPALTARLVADAAAARIRPAAARGWLARLRDALAEIGGAPGLAGVAAAGLAGVWIGFSGPGMTGDLMSRVWQGAAGAANPMAALVEEDPLGGAADELLTLMDTDE